MWAWLRRRPALKALALEQAGDLRQLRAELAAERRRADAAEGRETYWRIRAEKFLDQIALRQGIISEPSMRETPPPPRTAAATAFGALAVTELHRESAQASGPMTVTPVNLDAAAEVLRNL